MATINPYWDPENEYEWKDTVYTLTAYTPPRPPLRGIPSIFITKSFNNTPTDDAHTQHKPTYDYFDEKSLCDMETKTIKIKSEAFSLDMRCDHVLGAGNNSKECHEGCYVLEKGGKISKWHCKREDCEGHVYAGKVKVNDDGVACFGKKGRRLVCAERDSK